MDNSSRFTENIYAILNENKEEKRGTFTGVMKFDEPTSNPIIDDEELDLFQEMIAEAVKRVEVPLIEIHEQSSPHMDPQEAIIQLLQEASDYEEKLKKLIDLSQFMLEKNKEISNHNQQMTQQLNKKDEIITKIENGKKVLQDQLRDKAMAILIEHDKVQQLKQDMIEMEAQLNRQNAIKMELESQLKRDQPQQQSQLVFTESQVKAIEKNDNQYRDQIIALQKELKKEQQNKRELEDLVEKNVLLYEHESKKLDSIHKEWQKEKNSAMYYKKRYNRSKETSEKYQKLIDELENSVKELHEKLKAKEVEQQKIEKKKIKENAQQNLNLSIAGSNINTTQDMIEASNRSLNDSSYIFGKGRDSVVYKSLRMQKDKDLQSHIRLKRRVTNIKTPMQTQEPLVLSFPFPITRKVDHENIYKQELKKRRASFDVISPLQPDLLKKIADGVAQDGQYLLSQPTFMLGRNGIPTNLYKNQAQVADQLFLASDTKIDQSEFDIVAFALCINKHKCHKKSISVQYKTVYKDEVSQNANGQTLQVPVSKKQTLQPRSSESFVYNSNFIRKESYGNSFVALDPNTSVYINQPQRDSGENSRIERFEDSRIEGDILPEMFKDDDFQQNYQANNTYIENVEEQDQLNMSLVQYDQLAPLEDTQQFRPTLIDQFDRMSHVDQLQSAVTLTVDQSEVSNFFKSGLNADNARKGLQAYIFQQESNDLQERQYEDEFFFQQMRGQQDQEKIQVPKLSLQVSQHNEQVSLSIASFNEVLSKQQVQILMESHRDPKNEIALSSLSSIDFSQLKKNEISDQVMKLLKLQDQTDTKIQQSNLDSNEVYITARSNIIDELRQISVQKNDSQAIIDQPNVVFDNKKTFQALPNSQQQKESFLSHHTNEELEFDNGESPSRDISKNQEEQRGSIIPIMLGDSILVDRLTEAYKELEASILQEISEDFDSKMSDLDDIQIKRPQQPQKVRLQESSKVMKSIKKPLAIEVIEEMEFEDTSVNPYGNQISPGTMAGANFEFKNKMNDSYNKIFPTKLSYKSKEIMTPTDDKERTFFESLNKIPQETKLQTPKEQGGKLINDQGRFQSEIKKQLNSKSTNANTSEGEKIKAQLINCQYESNLERQFDEENRSISTSKSPDLRRDPHEEFFKLTLLAFKLNNKVSNSVLMTDPNDCYSECMKTKTPFYKWTGWIEQFMKRKMWNDRHNPQVAKVIKLMEANAEADVVLGEDMNIKQRHFK